jgi:hypothetical protein
MSIIPIYYRIICTANYIMPTLVTCLILGFEYTDGCHTRHNTKGFTMKKFLLLLIIVLALPLVLAASPVQAQELTYEISESQLNALARQALRLYPSYRSFRFEIQDGRIGIVAELRNPYTNGYSTIIMGIVPLVGPDKVEWMLMGASVDGQQLDGAQLAAFNVDFSLNPWFTDSLRAFAVRRYGNNLRVTNVVLANRTITMTLARGSAPAATPPVSGGTGNAAPAGCTVTTTSRLNLRQEPSTSATILAVVPASTTFTPINRANGWALVDFGGTQGYLAERFLRLSGCN